MNAKLTRKSSITTLALAGTLAARSAVLRRWVLLWAILAATVATLLAAPAANAFTIGEGRFASPGLGMDAAGTAYIAYNGSEVQNVAPLRFCRLPRGATACDAGAATTIATPGTSLSRPFIAVSGQRVVVVQQRYGADVPGFSALWAITSMDGGTSFGPARVVGKAVFHDAAVVGPGDTMTGTWANSEAIQNVPLDGSAPVDLSGNSTRPFAFFGGGFYPVAVGITDAATPLILHGGGSAQHRRYTGSGDINDPASWTAPSAIDGIVDYPSLAGGPRGLFLMANGSGGLYVRKFDGTNFAASVSLGSGRGQLFQDAGGRLHAVIERDNSSLVVHAVSDDGTTWQQGTVYTETVAGHGNGGLRVATAADHIGVVVWHGGPSEVRVAAVGPGAPASATPPPPPPPPPPAVVAPPARVVKAKPSFTTSGIARRTGRRYRIKIKGRLILPAGITAANGCNGTVKISVKRGATTIASKTVTVKSSCAFVFNATVRRAQVGRSRKLAIRIAFNGNNTLVPVTKVGSIKVKR